MSLALARKYRPAVFDDLIGQEAISQTLSLALDSNRLSHAYLFSGLRGSGKTSTARIFAKALLCEKGTTSHPCQECSHCIMANENRHIDIIEMDAASNRGIDDIKDLIEHTKYKPTLARYKIFIIDEVHMLTPQAFNALLKTLEEPPSFVKFILATTDPLKLPATILSRTQHFRFKKIPQNLVLSHLEHILNLENIGYEKEALEIIARNGAGSLRDSLTLLDQAIVYSKNFVDIGTVTGMLGIIDPNTLGQLLEDIMRKDRPKILAFVHMASEYEAEMILDELTLYLKELLFAQNTNFSTLMIERFFRVIADAKSLLALGSDGEFVLMLTLFKLIEALEIKEIDTMIKSLKTELQEVQISPQTISCTSPEEAVAPAEVIMITEEEIVSSLPLNKKANALDKERDENLPNQIFVESQTGCEESQAAQLSHLKNKTAQAQQSNTDQKKFEMLIEKIFDRNYELGACFEANIAFESFQNSRLTWVSTAQDEEKKLLIAHWGVINMFVKEIFGLETKIINTAKPGLSPMHTDDTDTKEKEETALFHADDESDECSGFSSMIEEIEMKNSCLTSASEEDEASKEKDPSAILKEPMIKEAIALFDPKKVRIKVNS